MPGGFRRRPRPTQTAPHVKGLGDGSERRGRCAWIAVVPKPSDRIASDDFSDVITEGHMKFSPSKSLDVMRSHESKESQSDCNQGGPIAWRHFRSLPWAGTTSQRQASTAPREGRQSAWDLASSPIDICILLSLRAGSNASTPDRSHRGFCNLPGSCLFHRRSQATQRSFTPRRRCEPGLLRTYCSHGSQCMVGQGSGGQGCR